MTNYYYSNEMASNADNRAGFGQHVQEVSAQQASQQTAQNPPLSQTFIPHCNSYAQTQAQTALPQSGLRPFFTPPPPAQPNPTYTDKTSTTSGITKQGQTKTQEFNSQLHNSANPLPLNGLGSFNNNFTQPKTPQSDLAQNSLYFNRPEQKALGASDLPLLTNDDLAKFNLLLQLGLGYKASRRAAFQPNQPNNNDLNPTQSSAQIAQEQNPNMPTTTGIATSYWDNLPANTSEYLLSTPARKSLKTYLQERCAHLDNNEIDEILTLAKELENQAVAVFKAKGTHKTKLQEQNRQATAKLSTNSAQINASKTYGEKTFTRAQIGKMSTKEFVQNQTEIFAQYAKGAIL